MSPANVGIRREDKSVWERRVPLVPQDVRRLVERGVRVTVQPSSTRIHPDDAYLRAGATLDEDLSSCSIVFGVKEMPIDVFVPGQAYMFFSHTIKGQPENMSMLQRLIDQRCHLIDYERIVDDNGKRLIFFGWHAGAAGMVESLVALAARARHNGIHNPFTDLQQPFRYDSIDGMRSALASVATHIEDSGVPQALRPLVVGVSGTGNVSQGAQAMLELLPVRSIAPEEIASIHSATPEASSAIYKVVFEERHLVRRRDGQAFDLQHYYDNPAAYDSIVEEALPHLTMLVNCMYWDARYPRLVTKRWLRNAWAGSRLQVIGDIGCDIDGAIEVTYRATEPSEPCYVYEPSSDSWKDGIAGDGPVIMAVDILPTELPADSSRHFSQVLMPWVEAIAKVDFGVSTDALELPAPIKRALILHDGSLTPAYRYLSEALP